METKEKKDTVIINFARMEIFTDITKTECVVQDIRKGFAGLMYRQCNGIEFHALALKIYQSEGEIELSDEEISLIHKVSEQLCTPAMIDSLREALSKK